MLRFTTFVFITFLLWFCTVNIYSRYVYIEPPKWYQTAHFDTGCLFIVYIVMTYFLLVHKRKS